MKPESCRISASSRPLSCPCAGNSSARRCGPGRRQDSDQFSRAGRHVAGAGGAQVLRAAGSRASYCGAGSTGAFSVRRTSGSRTPAGDGGRAPDRRDGKGPGARSRRTRTRIARTRELRDRLEATPGGRLSTGAAQRLARAAFAQHAERGLSRRRRRGACWWRSTWRGTWPVRWAARAPAARPSRHRRCWR